MANLYSILELPVFSDIPEVKKSFKRLALRYHPDINKNNPRAEELFKRINHAYQILSNEQKKRRYDGILKYQLNKPSYPVYRRKRPAGYRSTYSGGGRRTSKKAQRKYNIITLAFFGLGIILFQVITAVNESRLERDYKERVQEQAELISKSMKAFQNHEFRNAISLLNSVSYNSTDEKVSLLKELFLSFSDSVANELMAGEKYDSALYHLELVLENSRKVNPSVYTRISNCYRNQGKLDPAISILNSLLIVNPNNLIAHKELAYIYNYELGDYNTSLEHYELATKLIVDNYENYYGKAYIAIINPKNHPRSDFDVFLEKSKLYYNLNEIDSSLVASRWASFLQPQSPEAHFIQGLCWLKKGDNKKACREFEKIRNLGVILPELDSLKNISC